MLRIDLHLHSSFSDGLCSPPALVGYLKKNGVSVASLTDHDTVDGVDAFLSACGKSAVRGVTGLELSAEYDGVLHILGYRFDHKNESLGALLKKNKQERVGRNALICAKLRELGFDVTIEDARAVAGSDLIGRPHIARVLLKKGYVPSIKTAFDKYLKRGADAYVPRNLPAPEECIAAIRGAGGLPVLAHPYQTASDTDELVPVLKNLKQAGLWGLECFSLKRGAAEIYRYLAIADKLDLYPTAGTDSHGFARNFGVPVSEDLLPWAWFCGGL